MRTVLVIGASGFVGGRLAKGLIVHGFTVRAFSREPARLRALEAVGCQVVRGDVSTASSLAKAMGGIDAVYVSMHTLSPQQGDPGARFMEVEKGGLRNVIDACRSNGVSRIIYVTSLGVAAGRRSEWLRERWNAEELLLESGLAATVIRPGFIIGAGGRGFDTAARLAKRRIAFTLSGDRPKMRTIGIDDLVAYLIGVLDEPRSYGQRYDVGNDEIPGMNEIIDIAAHILGNRPPFKIHMPVPVVRLLAPLVERTGHLPAGAVRGFLDSLESDATGDPAPIRAVLPRTLLPFRDAMQRALKSEQG